MDLLPVLVALSQVVFPISKSVPKIQNEVESGEETKYGSLTPPVPPEADGVKIGFPEFKGVNSMAVLPFDSC